MDNRVIPLGKKEVREEREAAMQKNRDSAPNIQTDRHAAKAVSVHPSPTALPAMPAEVFYNSLALGGLGDEMECITGEPIAHDTGDGELF